MSLNSLTLEMIFTGEDRAGNAIQSVESGLRGMRDAAYQGADALEAQTVALQNASKVTRTNQRLQNLLRNEAYQTHEQFFSGAKLIGRYGNAAMKVNGVITAFNVTQIRGQEIAEDLAEAERNLSAAMQSGNLKDQIREQERVNKLKKEQLEFERQLPFQYLAQGLALTSLASDIGSIALDTSLFRKNRRLGLFGASSAAASTVGQFSGPGAKSGLGDLVGTGAGVGIGAVSSKLKGIGGKIKGFAGSTAGKVLLPLAAGVGTYEFLTETEEGRDINRNLNPFTHLFNGIFQATHSQGEIASAKAQQATADQAWLDSHGLGSTTGGNNMNFNAPVYIVTNGMSQEEIQASIEQYEGSYK